MDITKDKLREKLSDSWLGETRLGERNKQHGKSM